MCTILAHSETLSAQFTLASTARRQVDELMKRDSPVYVWFDRACYGNGGKGFYYVRSHPARMHLSTAYDMPELIVKKSKLRPVQVEFMERKCRETEEDEKMHKF